MEKRTNIFDIRHALIILLLLFISLSYISAQCGDQQTNFTALGTFGNSAYYLSNSPAQPIQAESNAMAIGGNLVSINSQAENDFILSMIDEMVYIGLTDAGPNTEGTLRWTNGDAVNYMNFDICNFCFDNDNINDNVLIHPWDGTWSFMNIWSARKYIVEIACDNNGGGNSGGGNSNCNTEISGFEFIGKYEDSNYFLSNDAMRWADANSTSQSAGGFLVNIGNSDENHFLQDKFNEMVFIGLNDGSAEGQLSWSGGTNHGYRNLDSNCSFCNDNDEENDFALIHPWNGAWSFTNQWSERRFIMEVPCDESGQGSSLSYNNCPPNRTIQLQSGQTSAFVNWTPPSLTNDCNAGVNSNALVSGPNNGADLSAGIYNIQYRGSNNCGDIALCNFTIEVKASNTGGNNTLSFLNCPADRTVLIDAGATTAFVSWTPPSVSSSCNLGGLSLGLQNGPRNNSNLGEGAYDVLYRAANNCGDAVECSFTINVISGNSQSSLSINCPTNIELTLPQGANTMPLTFQTPVINNQCGLIGTTLQQTGGPTRNSQVGAGTYTISYRATNNCNDVATCSFGVTISEEPIISSLVINCPNNNTFTTPAGSNTTTISWSNPNISNVCSLGGPFLTQIAGPGNNSTVGIGTYNIAYRVTNNCGDISECAFQITVNSGGGNGGGSNVDYTANDQVTPYTGLFRPGTNVGYNPPWTDEEMANLAAGNAQLGIDGIGARSMRPGLFEFITDQYGYDFRLSTYEHYASLGLNDLTMIVGFPSERHRDQTDYCGNGFNSSMFSNLYTDIWDNGENGTPYNDDNYYAAYIYEVVSRYGPYVKFWEIWNEPGFDLTGNRGWRQPGDPAGNWWDTDPDPCEYILRAPIEHYVRTLRISWEVIKSLQPDDYVVVAGVGFTSFLDAILRNTDDPFTGGLATPDYPLLGGAYFDVMGFHSYPDIDGSVYDYDFQTDTRVWKRHSDAAAQGIKNTMDNYQVILDKYNYNNVQFPHKEWIITEINVPRIPFRSEAMSGGEQMQINYIIKAVAVAMQNDVTQMHVYNLGDRTTEANAVTEFDLYGMHKRLTDTNPYSQVKNLEAIAYKSAADFVWESRYDAARTSQMNLPNNVDGVALRLDNGSYKYIIWAKTSIDQSEFASASYSFPTNFGYGQVYRRNWDFTETDQVQAIPSNNITLNGRPIFITETPDNLAIQSRQETKANHHLSVQDILPNPAVDDIKLTLESKVADKYMIQIYDATGKLMEQRNTFMKRGFSEECFDISAYPHGMYLVVIQGAQMRSTKVKFIKAKE